MTAPEILARFGSEIGRHEERTARAAQAAEMREAGRASEARGGARHRPTAAGGAARRGIGGALGAAAESVEKLILGIDDFLFATPRDPDAEPQAENERGEGEESIYDRFADLARDDEEDGRDDSGERDEDEQRERDRGRERSR